MRSSSSVPPPLDASEEFVFLGLELDDPIHYGPHVTDVLEHRDQPPKVASGSSPFLPTASLSGSNR